MGVGEQEPLQEGVGVGEVQVPLVVGGGGGGGATPVIGELLAAATALVRLEILASSGIDPPTPFNISSSLILS